ncbi:hypothetical protein F4778DRAFT_742943 [Xylariomycetidae sp. FL2044]|nr:hypothetical protein F4778DRAFT_742943 [Xylariomycetidae sp. FL2044]
MGREGKGRGRARRTNTFLYLVRVLGVAGCGIAGVPHTQGNGKRKTTWDQPAGMLYFILVLPVHVVMVEVIERSKR